MSAALNKFVNSLDDTAKDNLKDILSVIDTKKDYATTKSALTTIFLYKEYFGQSFDMISDQMNTKGMPVYIRKNRDIEKTLWSKDIVNYFYDKYKSKRDKFKIEKHADFIPL